MATLRNFIPKTDYAITSRVVERALSPITKEQINSLEKSLNELPDILGNDWYLSGGIAIQICCGEWYRMPGNVNISVHEDSILALTEKALKSHNYYLLSRGWQIKKSPKEKYETYEVPEWENNNLKKAYQNLRLIRFEGDSPVPNLSFLDFIDIHVYRKVEHRYEYYPDFNRVEAVSIDRNESDLIIPYDLTLTNAQYNTLSCRPIQTRSLAYMEVVKNWLIKDKVRSQERKAIDEFDISKIKEAKQKAART